MQVAHTPHTYNLIQYGLWLQDHFSTMGYTLQEVFHIDFGNSNLMLIKYAYDHYKLAKTDFKQAVDKLKQIIALYEAGNYTLPEKDKWFASADKFYDYVRKYWQDYGDLPLDKINKFYQYNRPEVRHAAMKDFRRFLQDVRHETVVEYPTLGEIQKLKEIRSVTHRSEGEDGKERMSVYDRPAITEHTFTLEEFYERDISIYPYLEPDEYYALVKPLQKMDIPFVVVKAVINHQIVNVILVEEYLADEDYEHYFTYMRNKIPTEYWDTLYVKKINEYDLLSFRDPMQELELIYEAADKQYKNPTRWFGYQRPCDVVTTPVRRFSLWLRAKDRVNGMLMITAGAPTGMSVEIGRYWQRVDLEDVATRKKIERGIEVYHDFGLLPFTKLVKELPKRETIMMLEIPIPEPFLVPKFKAELERVGAKVVPWYELPQQKVVEKKVIQLDDTDAEMLNMKCMHLVGKYLETMEDMVNVEKTCHAYRGLSDTYAYNPVPLRKQQMKAFKNIERYFHYTKGSPDFYLHTLKQSDEQWQWGQEHLKSLDIGEQMNVDSLVREFKLHEEHELPDEPTEELKSVDRLDHLFEKWKTYKPEDTDSESTAESESENEVKEEVKEK